MTDITERQKEILTHALGGKQNYRNHFVTGEGSTDHADCCALVELGLMWKSARKDELTGGGDLFHVTDEGRGEVGLVNPND
jgi:hypothetical protein